LINFSKARKGIMGVQNLRLSITIGLLVMDFTAWGLFPPPPPLQTSHPQLTNREQWLDFIQTTPLGKLFNFYHEANEVGLDVQNFDLLEPPLEHYPVDTADLPRYDDNDRRPFNG
jgi:hypothetical protein